MENEIGQGPKTGTCRAFVSHAYRDTDSRTEFLERLPKGFEPHFFAPITARPDELVSNPLTKAILESDVLIYFEGGWSDLSFWVAFERDYACRVGKPIFRFNLASGQLSRVSFTAMHLPVFPVFRTTDYSDVAKLLGIMRSERNFELFVPHMDIADQDEWRVYSERELYKALTQGGYTVVFWSKRAAASKRVTRMIERAYRFQPAEDPEDQKLLFALLDSTPLPEWYTQCLSMPSSSGFRPVQPVELVGDNALSLLNHLDDLIVRLYWLMWRKKYAI
jgi:hypothetical protein